MNEKTEQLVRELAEKLGTTVDHLWGVLIRQAMISGICDLIAIAGWALLAIWAVRIVKAKTSTPVASESDRYPSAEWENEGAFVAWLVLACFVGIGAFVAGTSLSGIAGSLMNPEYWALKQLLP